MILLLSRKHGGMIHVSGILGLRIISFLEGISKTGGGGEGAAFGKRRQETNVAKQPEDLLVGLREKKEKYMQWEQGCCQHVQGWNLER